MIEDYANQLKKVKSSRSWRYTAPFRYIWDYFFKFRKKTQEEITPHDNTPKKVLENNVLFILNSRKSRQKKIDSLVNKIRNHKKQNLKVTSQKVSIIIPCYNQIEYTIAAILSVLDCKSKLCFEIIVSDDCSFLDDYNIIVGISPIIKVIRTPTNYKFLKNCNFAASHAQGEYLVFLNNDCLPLYGWLDSLLDTIDSDPQIGIVGSKLLNVDGSLQEAGGVIWRDASGWNYGRGQNSLAPEYNYRKEVDYCTGASFCIKKTLWNEMGGFDDFFAPAYYEETDLSFRLREKGYQTVYQPKSVAIHLEGISNGTDLASGLKKHQVTNKQKFLDRWCEVLQRDHLVIGSHERFSRDRSKRKKHMLFIDHYIPEPDRDAGSKQMLLYLQLFNKNNYQITFWSQNQIYNSIYSSQLENIGIEVISNRAGTFDFSHWIHRNGKYFDISFLSRPHVAVNYFDEIRRNSSCNVVFYGHDLHVERMNLQNRMVPGSFSKEIVNTVREFEEECWDKSDLILYPSIDEVNLLRQKYPHRRINVLPIEFRNYTEINEAVTPNGFGERNGLLFVGGFSHLPNQDAVLWFLKEVYPLMAKKLPDLYVTIAGNAPTDEIYARASEAILVTGCVSEEELRSLYNKAKVVVAPLRIGAGVKGKVVESLRMGVPVVTTSIGVQGLPGYEDAIPVTDDPEAFAKMILNLLQDEALWQRRRDAGLKYYRDNFSESVVAPKVLALLNGDC